MANHRRTSNKCAVHDCIKIIWRNRSRYCSKHMNRDQNNGHPVAGSISSKEFDTRREWIDLGLLKYANTKGYHSGIRLADELLNFIPSQNFNVLLEIQRRMMILQGHGVTALDVLRRVCAYVAYVRLRPRPDDRSEDYGLARAVLRLAPLERYRPQGRLLKFLGPEIRERLYVFAHGFLDRLERDAAEAAALQRASADFDTVATCEP